VCHRREDSTATIATAEQYHKTETAQDTEDAFGAAEAEAAPPAETAAAATAERKQQQGR
jgi:hypothetical protein